jgi:hypothetical protein
MKIKRFFFTPCLEIVFFVVTLAGVLDDPDKAPL